MTVRPGDLISADEDGILILPRDLKPGEKRPVVVCQHGLEGRPQAVDLNRISAPPDQPGTPPFRRALREEVMRDDGLGGYCAGVYRQIAARRHHLPDSAHHALDLMAREDWLQSYTDLEGIADVLALWGMDGWLTPPLAPVVAASAVVSGRALTVQVAHDTSGPGLSPIAVMALLSPAGKRAWIAGQQLSRVCLTQMLTVTSACAACWMA